MASTSINADGSSLPTAGELSSVESKQAGKDYTIVTSPLSATPNPVRSVADPYYMVGQTMPDWNLSAWANSDPLSLESLRGNVVVVRFWTDASEACKRSMQALEGLAEDFREQPVTFVGIFCATGAYTEGEWTDAQSRARSWGIRIPLALDDRVGQVHWRTLSTWWQQHYDHLPTTPTFVIGPEGNVVHVHPGPELHPSSDPCHQLCNADFRDLRRAIQQSLEGKLAKTRSAG